jgi:ribosomal subunit interface protein
MIGLHPGEEPPSHRRCIDEGRTKMHHTLIGKNIEITPELREYFASKLDKLDRLIPTFADDLVSLQGTLEKNVKRGDYSTSLSLHFPQHTLHAEEQSRDLKGALGGAFAELIRQVDRFKSKLRGEHRWAPHKNSVSP